MNFKKTVPLLVLLFSTMACTENASRNWLQEPLTQQLTPGEIGRAFKQALTLGSNNVVSQLGKKNGFNADPSIHIPLPDSLDTVKNILSKFGMSEIVDDLELKLNRAAETATPKAQGLFLNAISQMTFDDINSIYNGPKDSATRYFKQKMTPSLIQEMRPIINESLSQVGAVQTFDKLMSKYQSLPFVPDVKAKLTDHVLEQSMGGIFFYMAQEEAAIRKDPVKQTTALLKKVFGSRY